MIRPLVYEPLSVREYFQSEGTFTVTNMFTRGTADVFLPCGCTVAGTVTLPGWSWCGVVTQDDRIICSTVHSGDLVPPQHFEFRGCIWRCRGWLATGDRLHAHYRMMTKEELRR